MHKLSKSSSSGTYPVRMLAIILAIVILFTAALKSPWLSERTMFLDSLAKKSSFGLGHVYSGFSLAVFVVVNHISFHYALYGPDIPACVFLWWLLSPWISSFYEELLRWLCGPPKKSSRLYDTATFQMLSASSWWPQSESRTLSHTARRRRHSNGGVAAWSSSTRNGI